MKIKYGLCLCLNFEVTMHWNKGLNIRHSPCNSVTLFTYPSLELMDIFSEQICNVTLKHLLRAGDEKVCKKHFVTGFQKGEQSKPLCGCDGRPSLGAGLNSM